MPELRGYCHPKFAAVRDALRWCVPRRGPGGAAVSVYHRGEHVVELAAGTKNRHGDPFESDTLCVSLSTTKGVTATLLHVLVDQGLVDLDEKVSAYWPEFGQAGKADITVRQVAAHQAGLYAVRSLAESVHAMLDWEVMIRAIERTPPAHAPGTNFGYHAWTFGYIVGEILERATGRSFDQLLETYLRVPLGLGGLYVGLPAHARSRCAEFVMPNIRRDIPPSVQRLGLYLLHLAARGIQINTNVYESVAALFPVGLFDLDLNDPAVLSAVMPSVNGAFDAHSLARLYAPLSQEGQLDGVRLLSAAAVREASTDQNQLFDRVIPFPLRIKLGYHRPVSLGLRLRCAGRSFDLGVANPNAFGHFGFGGSGAWADPERALSVGLVTNCFFGRLPLDLRTVAICTAANAGADRRG